MIAFQYQSSLLNFSCRSNVSVRVARFMDNVSTCRSRACIPRETYACIVCAWVRSRESSDTGRRRMELSKISNPTNPVGELPRQGGGSGVHLSAWISLREFISFFYMCETDTKSRWERIMYTVVCGSNAAGIRWESPNICTIYRKIIRFFLWRTNSTFRSDDWDMREHKMIHSESKRDNDSRCRFSKWIY